MYLKTKYHHFLTFYLFLDYARHLYLSLTETSPGIHIFCIWVCFCNFCSILSFLNCNFYFCFSRSYMFNNFFSTNISNSCSIFNNIYFFFDFIILSFIKSFAISEKIEKKKQILFFSSCLKLNDLPQYRRFLEDHLYL